MQVNVRNSTEARLEHITNDDDVLDEFWYRD